MTRSLVLVTGPFAAVNYPSIQIGLISSLVQGRGVPVNCLYANLSFSKRIDRRLYDLIADYRGFRVGDWLFASAAFPNLPNLDLFEVRFASELHALVQDAGVPPSYLQLVREKIVPDFVEEMAEQIAAQEPLVVGFSSTFEQNLASFAIAQSVKKRRSDIKVLFGGSNFDGEMGHEFFRAFDWIDAVVVGEIEPVVDSLLYELGFKDEYVPRAIGVLVDRLAVPASTITRATYTGDMNEIPLPDYSSYFKQLQCLGIDRNELGRQVVLPYEGARGCWWGQKHHCTFCGLNGAGMTFRSKSPVLVAAQMQELSNLYGIDRIAVVDNIIAPHFARDLIPHLQSSNKNLRIFYEVKANLKYEEIKNLASAGIVAIQPGIESLSTNILKLMNKGVRAIQNVNTLKWSFHFGISVSWNLLYGFPGEGVEDYDAQISTLKKVCHLPPPVGGGRIWLERFSPYYTGKAAGFRSIVPDESLKYIYPEGTDLQKIAYFFSGVSENSITDEEFSDTKAALTLWREMWARETPPYLVYSRDRGGLTVYDGRTDGMDPKIHRFNSLVAQILEICSEKPASISMIADALSTKFDRASVLKSVCLLLDRLESDGLILKEDELYLFLALPVPDTDCEQTSWFA